VILKKVVSAFLLGSALISCGKSEAELEQEAHIERLEAKYEAAMDDLYSPDPPADYKVDPALTAGACGNADLMELACKKYGTTCDVAELARKQCDQFSD
jgi:hypothetical protein